MFEAFGFYLIHREQDMLSPPSTNPETEQGRNNRERLLRSWVEISAYLVDFERRFGRCLLFQLYWSFFINELWIANTLKDYKCHKLWVKAESAREAYQTAIGAHVDQSKQMFARAYPYLVLIVIWSSSSRKAASANRRQSVGLGGTWYDTDVL